MALFISYSRLDKQSIDQMVNALRLIDEQVWFDEHLTGGQEWWTVILKQIRECDVFIYALSKNSQISRHCQAELQYGRTLERHILPVIVGPIDNKRVNPVADLQMVDYTRAGFYTGVQFCLAVQRLQRDRVPLPPTFPDDPDVPYRDLRAMSALLEDRQLEPNELTQLLQKIDSAFDRDRDDPFACDYITDLLTTLIAHPGATNRVRMEAEELLASIKSSKGSPWLTKIAWSRSGGLQRRMTWTKPAGSAPVASLAHVPPPGWYPDPSEGHGERFWDGTAWTDQRR
jgi:serine/threonine kinase PknH